MTTARLERFGGWTRAVGVAALMALAWAVLVPGGLFWSAVTVAGLVGSAAATALLMRSRSRPTLAQVITSAEAESVGVGVGVGYRGGAGLHPRGEGKP